MDMIELMNRVTFQSAGSFYGRSMLFEGHIGSLHIKDLPFIDAGLCGTAGENGEPQGGCLSWSPLFLIVS